MSKNPALAEYEISLGGRILMAISNSGIDFSDAEVAARNVLEELAPEIEELERHRLDDRPSHAHRPRRRTTRAIRPVG